ncbi:MAG: hypothetical protein VX923_07505 [Pseudomonadota bacterium]|nr:hypothetical protein [Pseudomonadota bacterium]
MQITQKYGQNSLIGRRVAAVINLPTRQIGKFMSEVLILAFPSNNSEVILIKPDIPVPNGGKLS